MYDKWDYFYSMRTFAWRKMIWGGRMPYSPRITCNEAGVTAVWRKCPGVHQALGYPVCTALWNVTEPLREGSFFYRWSLFSYSLNLVCTQDLLDLQYEVELMYNAKGRKLEAYSLSLWQLESISTMRPPILRSSPGWSMPHWNSQWFPVSDELASWPSHRQVKCHTCRARWDRESPGQQLRWNATSPQYL